jgi:hypothetical protein
VGVSRERESGTGSVKCRPPNFNLFKWDCIKNGKVLFFESRLRIRVLFQKLDSANQSGTSQVIHRAITQLPGGNGVPHFKHSGLFFKVYVASVDRSSGFRVFFVLSTALSGVAEMNSCKAKMTFGIISITNSC